MNDHDKFVDSLLKQGAKFRKTLRHGFPVTARKTISDNFPEMETKEISTHRSKKGGS
jgi:hypothetical protein